MGFFKNIFRNPVNIVRTVAAVVTNPAKLTTAIATGGLSVLAPKPFNFVTSAVDQTLFNPALALKVGSIATGGGAGLLLGGTTLGSGGGNPMAFNLGGFLSNIGSSFGGSSNSYLNALGTGAGFASAFVPATPVMSTLPALRPAMGAIAARVGGTVGRGFFNKYPNLATAIQGFRNAGKNVKRSQLYSMLRRFGPDFLITGGILSAAAISELMMAGPGRRRMNPANAHALRRAARRIKGFHKLCQHTDLIKTHRRSAKSGRGSSTQFVRQG